MVFPPTHFLHPPHHYPLQIDKKFPELPSEILPNRQAFDVAPLYPPWFSSLKLLPSMTMHHLDFPAPSENCQKDLILVRAHPRTSQTSKIFFFLLSSILSLSLPVPSIPPFPLHIYKHFLFSLSFFLVV